MYRDKNKYTLQPGHCAGIDNGLFIQHFSKVSLAKSLELLSRLSLSNFLHSRNSDTMSNTFF